MGYTTSAPIKNSRRWRRSAERVASPSRVAGLTEPAFAMCALLHYLAARGLDDLARAGRDLDARTAHRDRLVERARRADLGHLGLLRNDVRRLQRREIGRRACEARELVHAHLTRLVRRVRHEADLRQAPLHRALAALEAHLVV